MYLSINEEFNLHELQIIFVIQNLVNSYNSALEEYSRLKLRIKLNRDKNAFELQYQIYCIPQIEYHITHIHSICKYER